MKRLISCLLVANLFWPSGRACALIDLPPVRPSGDVPTEINTDTLNLASIFSRKMLPIQPLAGQWAMADGPFRGPFLLAASNPGNGNHGGGRGGQASSTPPGRFDPSRPNRPSTRRTILGGALGGGLALASGAVGYFFLEPIAKPATPSGPAATATPNPGSTGLPAFVPPTPVPNPGTPQQQVIAAAKNLLAHLDNDNWLPVRDGWTADDRQSYTDFLRAFVTDPNLSPSAVLAFPIGPMDASRTSQGLALQLRTVSVATVGPLELERELASELVTESPNQVALRQAALNAIAAAEGRPANDALAMDRVKHAIAMLTTWQANAWAVEMQVLRAQAAANRQDIVTFIRQSAGARDAQSQRILLELTSMTDSDPALKLSTNRAAMIADDNLRLVVSGNLEQQLHTIYTLEIDSLPPGPRVDFPTWLSTWIALPPYAELRASDSIRPVSATGPANGLNQRVRPIVFRRSA